MLKSPWLWSLSEEGHYRTDDFIVGTSMVEGLGRGFVTHRITLRY